MVGLWLMIGALNGLIAAAGGAYGWHSLASDEAVQEIFMMGVTYQMWHALAILAVAFVAGHPRMENSRLPAFAGGGFAVGILLFSGSLYAFALTGDIPIDGAAPAGGFILMAAWIALMIIGWKIIQSSRDQRS